MINFDHNSLLVIGLGVLGFILHEQRDDLRVLHAISGFLNYNLPLRSKKAGRFDKLLCFARSHFVVTGGSVSLSCATRLHPSCFSKS